MVVAVPRVEVESSASSIPSGVLVPGVYRAVLAHERELNERDDRRRRSGQCFRRDRSLAGLLEGGAAVVLRRSAVELALWMVERAPGRVSLPFDKSIRWVEIAADDRVAPAEDPEGGD